MRSASEETKKISTEEYETLFHKNDLAGRRDLSIEELESVTGGVLADPSSIVSYVYECSVMGCPCYQTTSTDLGEYTTHFICETHPDSLFIRTYGLDINLPGLDI